MKHIMEVAEDMTVADFVELDEEFLSEVAGAGDRPSTRPTGMLTSVCGVTQCIIIRD